MLPRSAPVTVHCWPLSPRSRVVCGTRSGHQRIHQPESATSLATTGGGTRRKVSSAMSTRGGATA